MRNAEKNVLRYQITLMVGAFPMCVSEGQFGGLAAPSDLISRVEVNSHWRRWPIYGVLGV